MKAALSLIITLMFALGNYLVQAQVTALDDRVGNGYWQSGVSGQWGDDLHAGPSFTGPDVPEDHTHFASFEIEATSYSEILLPQVLNYPEVIKEIKYAYARECLGIFGKYHFEVYVDETGEVIQAQGEHDEFLPYLMHMQFQPAKSRSQRASHQNLTTRVVEVGVRPAHLHVQSADQSSHRRDLSSLAPYFAA